MGKGGEEPVAGCEAFFFRRGGDLDVPAGGFEVGTLFGGRLVFAWDFLLFLVLWGGGERLF